MMLPPHLPFEGREVPLKYHKLLTGRGISPPNSLSALEDVVGGGAGVIEFDVNITCDGGFALLHDATLQRETTGVGAVRRSTLEEVRALRLRGSEENVAGLDEVVDRLRRVERPLKVQVDLKETLPLSAAEASNLIQALEPLLERPNLKLVIGCLADWNLRALRRVDSRLRLGFDFLSYLDAPVDELVRLPGRVNAYGYLDDHPLGWRRMQPVGAYLLDRVEALLTLVPETEEFYLRAEFVRQALSDGFDPIAFIHRWRPDALVDIWTIDRVPDGGRDQEVRSLLAAGADQITTNTAVQWAEALSSG